MKVVKHTGLVPVIALVGGTYRAGETFGLTPDKAIAAVKAGEVELFEPSHDVETYDVPGPREAPPPESARQESLIDEDVDIPENWEELHHLQRAKLAARVLGVEKLSPPEGVKTVVYADQVISDELAKRQAEAGEDADKTGTDGDGDEDPGNGDSDPQSGEGETGDQSKGPEVNPGAGPANPGEVGAEGTTE